MSQATLLSEILQSPDDDALRLVYADVLQSAGDPRGELIVVQCELARLGLDGEHIFRDWIGDELADAAAWDDGRVARLRKREAALLKQHGAGWIEAVRPHAVKAEGVRFRRGFVEHVGWDVYERIDRGLDALVAVAPLLRCLEFASYVRAGSMNALRSFFESPHLRRLHELYPSTDALQARGALPFLVDCGHLESLRRLCLGQIEAHALQPLAGAPYLPRLDAIVLNGFSQATELKGLLSVPTRLDELQLIDGDVGPAIAEELVKLASLAQVRILAVRAGRLGPGGATALLGGRSWPSLVALDLRNNKLRAEDAAIVTTLKTTRVINLSGNPLGDEGIERLFERGGFGALRALSLQKTNTTDTGVAALAGSPLLGSLRVLDLRKNQITDRGAAVLAKSKQVGGLRTLYIGGNQLTPAGKKALAAASALDGVRVHT